MSQELKEIDIDQVELSPHQPRKIFNESELEELAASIRSVGLLHPPLVRVVDGHHFLVSGERRMRAAQLAGLKRIPVIVEGLSEERSAQATLIENLQRVDLGALEVAQGLQRLMDDFGYQQEELAEKVGKPRSTVANYLRLLGLPGEIRISLKEGRISMGHAKALLGLSEERQRKLHQQILREGLSVRQAERRAKSEPRQERKDIHLEAVERAVEERMQRKVILTHNRLTLEYYSLDDLDRLLGDLDVNL